MPERTHKGRFHKLGPKHLQRYVNEFAGQRDIRETIPSTEIQHIVPRLIGKRLLYRALIAE